MREIIKDIDDVPDPWWVMPLILTLIIGGLAAIAIIGSIEYVDTYGY